MSQSLSVCIITYNEEANIGRTLASVAELVKQTAGEIVVVDSGSTDKTVEIAKSFGAKVFVEPWKGYAAQKNSAIEKASGDWILALDADEEVGPAARELMLHMFCGPDETLLGQPGIWFTRRNLFLGRWIKHGGFHESKVRLFKKGLGRFEDRLVHESVLLKGKAYDPHLHYDFGDQFALVHYAYATLQSYIGHMNKYSTLGAEMAVKEKPRGFSLWNIVIRPWATFVYNYFFRLGFLDGREGLLLHMYHAVYVSWKYAKAWEMSKNKR